MIEFLFGFASGIIALSAYFLFLAFRRKGYAGIVKEIEQSKGLKK